MPDQEALSSKQEWKRAGVGGGGGKAWSNIKKLKIFKASTLGGKGT
jgi:hypothetical protein